MLRRLLGIQEEDRRPVAAAFATLLAVLVGHAMLETARDALFLDKLPARYLTLAYIAIAALALLVSKLNRGLIVRFSRRRLLSMSLLTGGLVTGGFGLLAGGGGAWLLGALYVWTGLLATVVVMQFWLLLSDVLDVGRAKRLYSIIGAGGLLGATLGSLAAGSLTSLLGPRGVVLAAALVFIASAWLPQTFPAPAVQAPARRRSTASPVAKAGGSSWSMLRNDRYLQRLLLMLLLGAVLVTGVDYLFKAMVAEHARQTGMSLGVFFARYYSVVNALALVVQLLVAPRLLQAAGVNRALYITPILLLVGAAGSALSMGLLSVLLLKGADGTLRHSLHRTASEILFLPLPRRTRERFKGLSEALGQRGGQALASLAILGVTALSADPRYIAMGLVVLAILWIATLFGLQPLYLELFREQLRAGMLDTEIEVAELDLASFELLVSALSAEGDEEVIAALGMFENYGRGNLIPALILYHPSAPVVLRAFDLLDPRRRDVQRLSRRLLQHEDADIRARALRTLSAFELDEELLRSHLEDRAAAVRCTALVTLIGADRLDENEAREQLRQDLDQGDEGTQLALARTLVHLRDERHDWISARLIETGRPGVLAEIARSVARHPHERHIPLLTRLLSDREARAEARHALVTIGPKALEALGDALQDEQLPRPLRLHLPRSISRFSNQRAMDILQAALLSVDDARIELKIARGLIALRTADRNLTIDDKPLIVAAEQALQVCIRALHYRVSVQAMLQYQTDREQPAGELLVELLGDMQRHALQQVFRLQHIVTPSARFDVMYEGWRSADPGRRASSQELIAHAASASLRESLLALTDTAPAVEQLNRMASFYSPADRKAFKIALRRFESGRSSAAESALSEAYMNVVRSMTNERSEALPGIIEHHLSELDLTQFRQQLQTAARSGRDTLKQAAERALRLFELRLEPTRVR